MTQLAGNPTRDLSNRATTKGYFRGKSPLKEGQIQRWNHILDNQDPYGMTSAVSTG